MQAETILPSNLNSSITKNFKLHFIPKTNYCEQYWLEWFLLTHSDAEVMVQIVKWSKSANLARKQKGDGPEKKLGMISSCNRWKNWIMSAEQRMMLCLQHLSRNSSSLHISLKQNGPDTRQHQCTSYTWNPKWLVNHYRILTMKYVRMTLVLHSEPWYRLIYSVKRFALNLLAIFPLITEQVVVNCKCPTVFSLLRIYCFSTIQNSFWSNKWTIL